MYKKKYHILYIIFLNFIFLKTEITKKFTVKKYKIKKNKVNQKYCVANDSLSSWGIQNFNNLTQCQWEFLVHFFNKGLISPIINNINIIKSFLFF